MDIVSFVILHYKDLSVTDKCVQSILNMNRQEQIRIVIVDNDVNDSKDQREKIRQRYLTEKRISVIQIKENGGFSYANNIGYRYAKEELQSSFIVILNNDIEFRQEDFLKFLLQSYRKSPCHIIGPDVIKESTGEHQNPIDEKIRTVKEAEYTIKMNQLALRFYSIFYPVLYWKMKKDEKLLLAQKKEKERYYLSRQENIVPFGACLIFTPLFIASEERAFWPETQFFYEEYLLAYRCQKNNYSIIYDPSMVVIHESGAVTKKSYKTERKRLQFMLQRTLEACKIYKKTIEEKTEI